MKRILFILLMVGLLLAVVGCTKEDISTVNATVSRMQFVEAWTEQTYTSEPMYDQYGEPVYDSYGDQMYHDVPINIDHPEQYLVYFKFENMEANVDNEGLFNSLKVGDPVEASVHCSVDDNGKIVKKWLTEYQEPTTDNNRNSIKGMGY